ncbi:unnamed protein product, partial [Closterium sp. NIES-53]
ATAATTAATATAAATATPACCATMASLRVLAFDHEDRSIQFDTWLDDVQLYLQSDSKDSVSLFDLASGAATAPPTTANSATRSQWLTLDADARLAIRNNLPLAECAHFRQHRIAQALYDAVVARYSSPATAALGQLLLPYLFPELSDFATVEDLVLIVELRARPSLSDALPPPLPPPTPLLLLQTSLLLRTSGLLLLVRSAAVARARVAGVVEVAAVVVEVAAGVVGGGAVEVVEAVEVVAAVGLVAGVGALVAAGEAAVGVAAVAAMGLVALRVDLGVEALALDDASRAEFGDDVERPRWADLLRSGVAIFDLDFDVILSAMYALSASAEGDFYRCVPPDLGIAAAALGASESGTLPGTARAEALHTFTLDAGASRCFFRESTTLTPLPAPVPVRLAYPSGGPLVARSSTVLPCLAVPSGSLSGLHLPSFSTNLVSTAALQDAMVTTTTPGGQLVSICTCTQKGRHLATFTRWPRSSLYTLATEPPQVAASAQVFASGQVAASCSCRLLSHQTLLWHHRLGHPSLPRLRGMHSRLLGLECYFLLVVDDYTRYTTLFPLRSKGEVVYSFMLPDSPQQNGIGERRIGLVMEVTRTSMIHAAAPHFLWPFAVRYAAHQLNLWPRVSLPETSPTLRWMGEVGDASVFQFYHPTSRRVFLSQDITFDESVPFYRLFPYRSAPPPPPPLFLVLFCITLHVNWPCGSLLELGLYGDFVIHLELALLYLTAPALPSQAVPLLRAAPSCRNPPPGAEPRRPAESRRPTEPRRPAEPRRPTDPRRPARAAPAATAASATTAATAAPAAMASPNVLTFDDEGRAVDFDEWVDDLQFFLHCDSKDGVSLFDHTSGVSPAPAATADSTVRSQWTTRDAVARLVVRSHLVVASASSTRVPVRPRRPSNFAAALGASESAASGTSESAAAGAGESALSGTAPTEAWHTFTLDSGASRSFFCDSTTLTPLSQPVAVSLADPSGGPVLAHYSTVLPCPAAPSGLLSGIHLPSFSTNLVSGADLQDVWVDQFTPGGQRVTNCTCSRTGRHLATFTRRPGSSLYTLTTASPPVTASCQVAASGQVFAAASRSSPASAPCSCRPLSHETLLWHHRLGHPSLPRLRGMASRTLVSGLPRSLPPLPPGPAPTCVPCVKGRQRAAPYSFELPPTEAPLQTLHMDVWGPARVRGQGHQRYFLLVVIDYSRYTTVFPLRRKGEVTERDYELHSLDFSTAFLQGSLHEEIWLRHPPGFTGSFSAGTQWSLRRPLYGLRQAPRERQFTLRTTLAALGFAPSTADPSMFLRTDTTLPPFYVLVYVDDLVFPTADTEALALVKSELQKRHTCTDLGELTSYLGLRITRDIAQRTITLTRSHMVQQVLQCFGFTYSSPQSTPLHNGHSLSAPPSDESVEPSGQYPELVGCRITSGMGLVLGGRARVVLTGHADASWADNLTTRRSSCEAEIYAGAMAAQELRWLTYLLTNLGGPPRSPLVLYVDNKAMIALCQEHRLKHRTKNIALRYFLARELQQCGQLRLAYMATRANTADDFTKALHVKKQEWMN